VHIFGRSRRATGERGEGIPEANPETPPDSTDPSGPCPRCGRVSNFAKIGDLPVSFGGSVLQRPDGTSERDAVDRVSSLMCQGCGQATAVIEEKWVGDQPVRSGVSRGGMVTYRGVHWWPAPGAGDLDAAIPEAIREAYAEGIRTLGVRSPRAAAVMFRRTLEAVVDDKGGPAAKAAAGKNLASALSEMVKEGTLDPNLADWAKEIRIVGNVGAHFDPLGDVQQAEAESLAKLLRSMLEYLYEMPARVQRTRTTGST
jgi:hypothetical protein